MGFTDENKGEDTSNKKPKNTVKSDCKSSWKGKDTELAFCPIHDEHFWIMRGKYCKFYEKETHHIISDGNGKIEKEKSTGFTSNSQVITSNSQAGLDLSITCKPKRSYKKTVKDSVYERFHNYGVKFTAVVQWDALFKFEEKNLRNNVSYKRVDLPNAIVRVFKKSILITLRSSKDIHGKLVREAESIAIQMVIDAVHQLPSAIKVDEREVASIHNAFVNHPTAKLFKQVYGREMNIKDENGDTHLITDNSHGHELEYTNKESAVPLSEHRAQYEAHLIFKKPDFPTVQDRKITDMYGLLHKTNDLLNKGNDATLLEIENKRLHMEVLHEMKDTMKEIRDDLRRKNRVKPVKKESRADKIKKFKERYS